MKTVDLAGLGPVPRLGLGCMGMSEFYGPIPAEADAFALMDAAWEAGVRLYDTADLYGDGANETLVGRWKARAPGDALIATKCGITRTNEILPNGHFKRGVDGSPAYIRAACERSLARLGIDVIDLFYLHRLDPKVPVEESVGALADLVRAGKVRAIGLSEATAEQLRRAQAVHPITALQSEYSLLSRDVEAEILPTCRELGVAFVPYSPLGRGIVPPRRGQSDLGFAPDDFRLALDRTQPENMSRNAPLFDLLHDVAGEAGITVYQVMLAWVFAKSRGDILPIPGSRRRANLDANVVAEGITLDPALVAKLDDAFAPGNVAGGRYTVSPTPAVGKRAAGGRG